MKKLIFICCLIIEGCAFYIHDQDVCTITRMG